MDCATFMCEEIVIEILSRLPAKSLMRFMAVCRLWKSIITSPQFRLVSNRPTKLLVHTDREFYTHVEDGEENRLIYETEFPPKHCSSEGTEVIGSDNGLICIHIRTGNYRVIIWNLCIRKHVVIPNNPMNDNIARVFDYGFGGTTSRRDYKYVEAVGLHNGGGIEGVKKAVDIYSLKAGTWRRKYLDWDITETGIAGSFSLHSSSALLRGRLHWIGRRKNQIFSFELENEVFENIIMVPESIRSHSVCVNVIRESLAVLATDQIGRECSAVWVMEEYGDVNSWIKLWNIDLNLENFERRVIFSLLKNGDLLLCLVEKVYYSPVKLVTYNPQTMKTRYFGGGSSLLLPQEVCGFTNHYKESLVLLADDYHAAADQPTLQGRHHGYYPASRTGGAFSYPLVRNLPMFFQPATYFQGYYPVWTGGPGFHSYPLFQDQYGSYYAWTGFNWLRITNNNPFVTIQ